MASIEGFPVIEAQFDKDAKPVDPQVTSHVVDFVKQQELTDLIVLSHGWNNDMADARELYTKILRSMRAVLDGGSLPALAPRKLGVMAIFWPSKKFTDAELIPGGAASAGDALDQFLTDRLEGLKPLVDGNPDRLEQAKTLVSDLEDSASARRRFVDLLRDVLPKTTDGADDASDAFFGADGDALLKDLQAPMAGGPGPSSGGAASIEDAEVGQAAGLGDVLSNIRAGALRLLNFATYYQMKERAGRVGAEAVHPLLREVRRQVPALKVHLVGHSFGGRLVSAVANGTAGTPILGVSSMTLLQAAFSHHGFAPKDDARGRPVGFFRDVVTGRKVGGPILITHTVHDTAVGLAYPLSSRIARQQASGLGDENDPYGGIGRNGAVNTAEAVRGTLLAVPAPGAAGYTLEGGKVYNLRADVIENHSDVHGREVAYAMLSAVAAGA